MKNLKILFLTTLLIVITPVFIVADDNDSHGSDFEPVNNETYSEECGMCHFAYFPGMLPSQSWKLLLSDLKLGNHFGEVIEINEATKNQIIDYLIKYSADRSKYRRSKKIMRSLGHDSIPNRISEIPYIKDKHRKIPQKLINENSEVESLSNCDSCHREAEKGIFDDDTVLIPGYGKWDDD
jgi:hypothetical protein